jgi:hypothetical protein
MENKRTLNVLLLILISSLILWKIWDWNKQNNLRKQVETANKRNWLVQKNLQERADLQKQSDSLEIGACMSGFVENKIMSRKRANRFCSCFIPYLNEKYTDEQMQTSFDSLVKVEVPKYQECMKNAQK